MVVSRTPIIGSDAITEVAYRFDKQVLEVTFKSGGTYAYSGVPKSVYESLMQSSSKGGFVMSNIKNKFPAAEIT